MEMQGYSAKGIVSEFDLHSFARIKLFVWVWSNSSLHSYNTKYTVYVYLYTTALETRQTFWAIPDSKCLERKKKKTVLVRSSCLRFVTSPSRFLQGKQLPTAQDWPSIPLNPASGDSIKPIVPPNPFKHLGSWSINVHNVRYRIIRSCTVLWFPCSSPSCASRPLHRGRMLEQRIPSWICGAPQRNMWSPLAALAPFGWIWKLFWQWVTPAITDCPDVDWPKMLWLWLFGQFGPNLKN